MEDPKPESSPPPRMTPDDRTPTGKARKDTLSMGEAFAKIAPREPVPPPSPTGFGKPRRRR